MDHGQEFAKGNEAVARLLRGEYDLTEAMRIGDPILGCMDEGIRYARYRLAGSGILLGEEQTIALVEKYKLEVGFHPECGAVKKYKVEVEGIIDPSREEVDDHSKRWSKHIAAKARTRAVEMALERPEHRHIARVVYFDGTGRMTSCKGLPLGFIVSRKILPHDYAIKEVVAAVDIAFNHGFNDLLTAAHPFLLVGLGDSQDQANELADELTTHALPQLTEHERSSVKVISIAA